MTIGVALHSLFAGKLSPRVLLPTMQNWSLISPILPCRRHIRHQTRLQRRRIEDQSRARAEPPKCARLAHLIEGMVCPPTRRQSPAGLMNRPQGHRYEYPPFVKSMISRCVRPEERCRSAASVLIVRRVVSTTSFSRISLRSEPKSTR